MRRVPPIKDMFFIPAAVQSVLDHRDHWPDIRDSNGFSIVVIIIMAGSLFGFHFRGFALAAAAGIPRARLCSNTLLSSIYRLNIARLISGPRKAR